MGLVQKKQMVNSVRFQLDEPVRPKKAEETGAPASAEDSGIQLNKTGILAVPDPVTQPDGAAENGAAKEGFSLAELTAKLRKK